MSDKDFVLSRNSRAICKAHEYSTAVHWVVWFGLLPIAHGGSHFEAWANAAARIREREQQEKV